MSEPSAWAGALYHAPRQAKLARADSVRIVVPTVVLGEWWRGRTKARELLIGPVQREPLNESLAKLAGARTPRAPHMGRGATDSGGTVKLSMPSCSIASNATSSAA